MCEFCGNAACTLTKQKVVERGAILENNVYSIMRIPTEDAPQTYSFKGVPAFYSLSALIPDEDEENPHAQKERGILAQIKRIRQQRAAQRL